MSSAVDILVHIFVSVIVGFYFVVVSCNVQVYWSSPFVRGNYAWETEQKWSILLPFICKFLMICVSLFHFSLCSFCLFLEILKQTDNNCSGFFFFFLPEAFLWIWKWTSSIYKTYCFFAHVRIFCNFRSNLSLGKQLQFLKGSIYYSRFYKKLLNG